MPSPCDSCKENCGEGDEKCGADCKCGPNCKCADNPAQSCGCTGSAANPTEDN